MSHEASLNEITLARECLQHLAEEDGVLWRVGHVLDLIAHNSEGLGEVLQDFAHQTAAQIHEVIRAARNMSAGACYSDDSEVIAQLHTVMKTACTVLSMTPAAMQRNKAGTIGHKEKISREDVMQLAHTFAHAPEILQVLNSENSGQHIVTLLSGTPQAALMAQATAPAHSASAHQSQASH